MECHASRVRCRRERSIQTLCIEKKINQLFIITLVNKHNLISTYINKLFSVCFFIFFIFPLLRSRLILCFLASSFFMREKRNSLIFMLLFLSLNDILYLSRKNII